jgi:hypothetical protein
MKDNNDCRLWLGRTKAEQKYDFRESNLARFVGQQTLIKHILGLAWNLVASGAFDHDGLAFHKFRRGSGARSAL